VSTFLLSRSRVVILHEEIQVQSVTMEGALKKGDKESAWSDANTEVEDLINDNGWPVTVEAVSN